MQYAASVRDHQGSWNNRAPKALGQCSIGPGLLLPDGIAEVDGLLVGQSPREATCHRATSASAARWCAKGGALAPETPAEPLPLAYASHTPGRL